HTTFCRRNWCRRWRTHRWAATCPWSCTRYKPAWSCCIVIVLIELLQAGAMVADVAGARHRVGHDLLFHGEVPVLNTRIGHVAVEVGYPAATARQALGSIGGLHQVRRVLARDVLGHRAQAEVRDAVRRRGRLR